MYVRDRKGRVNPHRREQSLTIFGIDITLTGTPINPERLKTYYVFLYKYPLLYNS